MSHWCSTIKLPCIVMTILSRSIRSKRLMFVRPFVWTSCPYKHVCDVCCLSLCGTLILYTGLLAWYMQSISLSLSNVSSERNCMIGGSYWISLFMLKYLCGHASHVHTHTNTHSWKTVCVLLASALMIFSLSIKFFLTLATSLFILC